jgi:hypothetical protein
VKERLYGIRIFRGEWVVGLDRIEKRVRAGDLNYCVKVGLLWCGGTGVEKNVE